MKYNRKIILIGAILIVAILLTCTGLILKRTSENPQLKGIPAIAVPFAVVQDTTLLTAPDPQYPFVNHTAGVESNFKKPVIEYEEPRVEAEQIVKEFSVVTEDYFADALFIGDSRTVGLGLYAPIGDATYFGSVGMTSFSVFKTTAKDTGLNSYLETVLTQNTYGKIYFMVGINELGCNRESQEEAYLEALNRIRELQPDAIIFLMANLNVTYNRSVSDKYINRESVNSFNQWIQTNANDYNIFYLDANPLFCDEEGYLKSSLSWDGAHVYASVYSEWKTYLLEHGIE
ncbi:MAG: hypothetical protein IJ017_07870 [Oscillospiraceae bacterium]|nr:hypothetical protein [Oscillospiraceae bacterium]